MTRPRVAITPWLRELPTPLGERTRLYALDPAYAATTSSSPPDPQSSACSDARG